MYVGTYFLYFLLFDVPMSPSAPAQPSHHTVTGLGQVFCCLLPPLGCMVCILSYTRLHTAILYTYKPLYEISFVSYICIYMVVYMLDGVRFL